MTARSARALEQQLVSAFIACFSFAMGLLVSPAVQITEYEAEQQSVEEALFGSLPSDQFTVIRKATQRLMNADLGRIKRMMQVEAMILQAYSERPDIARTLNCSVDTVRRDIQTLCEMGSDAKYQPKRGWRATTAIFVANQSFEPPIDDEVYTDEVDP